MLTERTWRATFVRFFHVLRNVKYPSLPLKFFSLPFKLLTKKTLCLWSTNHFWTVTLMAILIHPNLFLPERRNMLTSMATSMIHFMCDVGSHIMLFCAGLNVGCRPLWATSTLMWCKKLRVS